MWERSFVQAPLPQPNLHSKWQSPTLHNVQLVPKTLSKVKVPSCKMFNWSPKEKPPPNSHLAKSLTGPQNPFKSGGFPPPLSSTKFKRPEILLKVQLVPKPFQVKVKSLPPPHILPKVQLVPKSYPKWKSPPPILLSFSSSCQESHSIRFQSTPRSLRTQSIHLTSWIQTKTFISISVFSND